jgi:outer membrane protein OmpA-like peptidoglycan-associated protein
VLVARLADALLSVPAMSTALDGGAMTHTRIALFLVALAVVASGCATKDWVTKVVGKERVETDQKVEQVEQRVGQVDARVADEGRRLEGRIGEESKRIDTVGTQVKAVEDTAATARGEAVAARTRADEVDGRVTRLWAARHKRTVVESVPVHFGFDKFELNDGAQTALLPLIEELKKNPALGVVLEGYTDPRGPRTYNLELSRRRVEAVRRHLVASGIEMWRIDALGLGPIEAKGTPDAQKRRVTVTLTLSE